MSLLYVAQTREEFEWANRVWMNRRASVPGVKVVKLAPWWWRVLRSAGWPVRLRYGMRARWPRG